MTDEKSALLDLASQLRRRAQQADESDFVLRAAESKPKSDSSAVSSVPPPPSSSPRGPASGKHERLSSLSAEVSACRLCPLGAARLKPVFGVGSADAQVMFVGEGPGFEEDHRGEPFVGRSGQLLDRILESIGLARSTVYIANIVKCHPMKDPGDPEARANDRPPTPEEIAACRRYLDAQIRIIAPKVIVTLGAVAARVLLDDASPITKIRGQWRLYAPEGGPEVKLLPTFHPAALLRNPNLKKDVWVDMKNLRAELGAARASETP